MAKVIQFPASGPDKFGFKPVRKESPSKPTAQLPLFQTGKVVNLHPLSTFEEALLLDQHGDKRAKSLYQKAIEQGDSIADSYCNLGILESQEGNYAKAVDCFTQCLKENPRHFEAHYNLANLYADLGNYTLAKVHYKVSIELEPDFPNSYFNLGLTLVLNKEVDAAIETLTAYCKLVSIGDQQQALDLIARLRETQS